MQVITAPELAQWLADAGRAKPVLLDVREDIEIRTAAMPGITHIPMGQIPGRLNDIDEDAEIVCICHHGARSMQVAKLPGAPGLCQGLQPDRRHSRLVRSIRPSRSPDHRLAHGPHPPGTIPQQQPRSPCRTTPYHPS
jgi:hypothetical protein